MKIKSIIPILLGCFILAAAGLAVWTKHSIDQKISQSIQSVFPKASVHFKNWQFALPLGFKLNDLSIKTDYAEISIPSVTARAGLKSLLSHKIDTVLFEEPRIKMTAFPAGSPVSETLNTKSETQAFALQELQISELKLSYASKDLNFKVELSLNLDVADQIIQKADLFVPLFQAKDFKAESTRIEIASATAPGTLHVDTIQYQKLKIRDIKGSVLIDKNQIQVTQVTTDLFEGKLLAEFTLQLKPGFPFNGSIEARPIQLAAVLNDFELNKKMDAKAFLIGTIKIQGRLDSLTTLTGSFEVDEKGGDLIITDPGFLETLAKNTKQPLAIIEASFKEYHFDVGSLKLGKEDKNLGLEIHLDGPKGKRDLNVQLHDLFD